MDATQHAYYPHVFKLVYIKNVITDIKLTRNINLWFDVAVALLAVVQTVFHCFSICDIEILLVYVQTSQVIWKEEGWEKEENESTLAELCTLVD